MGLADTPPRTGWAVSGHSPVGSLKTFCARDRAQPPFPFPSAVCWEGFGFLGLGQKGGRKGVRVPGTKPFEALLGGTIIEFQRQTRNIQRMQRAGLVLILNEQINFSMTFLRQWGEIEYGRRAN